MSTSRGKKLGKPPSIIMKNTMTFIALVYPTVRKGEMKFESNINYCSSLY